MNIIDELSITHAEIDILTLQLQLFDMSLEDPRQRSKCAVVVQSAAT